jgi:hypothetical protein
MRRRGKKKPTEGDGRMNVISVKRTSELICRAGSTRLRLRIKIPQAALHCATMYPAFLTVFPLLLSVFAHKEATTPEEKAIERGLRNAAYHVSQTLGLPDDLLNFVVQRFSVHQR